MQQQQRAQILSPQHEKCACTYYYSKFKLPSDSRVASARMYARVTPPSPPQVGSMVYIKESSPECCCPPGYNNELKTGTFFCPKNMLEDTAGSTAEATLKWLKSKR